MRAAPNRASSGGTSITEERISSGSLWMAGSKFVCSWWMRSTPSLSSPSTRLPSSRNTARILRTSVMSGTPRSVTGSRVSSVAERIGSTAFLLAEGVIRPLKGRPPWTDEIGHVDSFRASLLNVAPS